MRPTQPRYMTSASVVLALTVGSSAVIAQTTTSKVGAAGPSVSARPQTGSQLEFTVCGSSATFPLEVSTKTPTMVELPSGFQKFLHKGGTAYTIKRDGKNKLYIALPEDTEPGHELAIRIRVTGPVSFEASLHTRAVRHLNGVRDNVVIYHQSDKARFGQQPGDNPCLLEGLTPLQRLRIRAFDRQQGESRAIGIPEIEQVVRSGEWLPISLPMYEMEDGNLIVDLKAANQHAATVKVDEVRVRDQHGDEVSSSIWHWDDQGKPTTDQGEKGLSIAAFQDMHASIHIPNADKHALEPMWVEFRGTRAGMPFTTTVQVGTFRQMTPEEIAQMKRDEELRRLNEERKARAWERNRKAKQVAVSVRGLFGTLWVGPGTPALTDQVGVDGAAMGGFSVRVTKGMHHNFAIGIEATGGRSGQAYFSDTSWQGLQGDVSRQASFGRVQGYGVVRFGVRYIASMRLGVGVQGASYESHFMTGGTTMQGPGKSFEIDGVWLFGAGLDFPLANSWTLGLGAALAGGIYTSARGLDAGLHLSYRWLP